ncbi:DMT family transporter [Fundicoccus culcitae]|uniref:DMT family transporter n=1 Tax=Fundicoccus culcitae TaxID=2969821 RepID=A0ABY5P8L6_9LACT|nr:DMT family transporter [Fundicoccus culcitae]UUX35014.1 DMT family transporter [Fundicoccus culcitae]
MSNKISKVALFVVAVIWGLGYVATAVALVTLTPYQILAVRFTLAFVLLLIFQGSKLRQLNRRSFLRGSLIGIFLFLGFVFQTVGLQYTTPSKNAFLSAVNIVIVPFLSWLILKHKIPRNAIIGSLVALSGVAILTLNQSLNQINIGDILTLLGALFFALQIFTTDTYAKTESAWVIMILQTGVASVLSWIVVLINGEWRMPLTWESGLAVGYLGIFSTLVAYGLQTWAQKRTSGTETVVILSTEAFFGMLASVILLHEPVTLELLLGGGLIFLGVLITDLKPPRRFHMKRRN